MILGELIVRLVVAIIAMSGSAYAAVPTLSGTLESDSGPTLPGLLVIGGVVSDGTPVSTVTPEPSVVVEPVEYSTVIPIEPPSGDIAGILRAAGWPEWVIPAALSVVNCESGGQNVQNQAGGPYYGIFQIHWDGIPGSYHGDKLVALGYPDDVSMLFNPLINAQVALMIWQSSGWAPWDCKP